jgi:ABC-type transport system substrate-binding protein
MRKLVLGCSAAAFAIWIPCLVAGTASAEEPKQGGRMTLSYKDDVSTLDPAIGYDWQNPSLMQAIFDGLMDYKAGTFELTPDLAEEYALSDDGTTYSFKLRRGVKFQNGRELTSADVRYSIERILNPDTQSPAQSYFNVIAGSDEFASGAQKQVSGIETPDPYTVTIKLKQPKATFLNVLAMHFGSVVPKEEVERHGPDFGHHPVGSGAFKLVEWTPGQRLVLQRNADYFRPELPRLDEVIILVGQDPSVSLLRVKRGEVDLTGDGIPPAQFQSVMEDSALKSQVVIGKQLQTSYLALNVKVPPLDDLKVRQAINMAVNKERIVRLINNRAVPASQPLPPAMPGHDPGYKGYAFDPEGARKLLAEAGHPDGFATTLYTINTDPHPRIAQAIQQDLSQIGIRAELKPLASSAVIQAGGTPGEAAMIWSGGMAWIADFPDPSGFYWTILGCAGATEGGWNWAWYCNKEIDDRATKADAMVSPDQHEERVQLWRSIFLDVMKDAPWVPIFHEDFYTLHSSRIEGEEHFFVSPTHIPIYYEMLQAGDGQ